VACFCTTIALSFVRCIAMLCFALLPTACAASTWFKLFSFLKYGAASPNVSPRQVSLCSFQFLYYCGPRHFNFFCKKLLTPLLLLKGGDGLSLLLHGRILFAVPYFLRIFLIAALILSVSYYAVSLTITFMVFTLYYALLYIKIYKLKKSFFFFE